MKLDISIPTDVEQRVIDAFARRHEYKDEVPDAIGSALIPNPQSRAAFLKEQVIAYILASVEAEEIEVAMVAAREDAKARVKKDVRLG